LKKVVKYSQKEIEAVVAEYWKEKRVPERLPEMRKGAKKFYLLDGPPYVNNEMHVGNLKTTVCKDVWSKFKYMQGYDVFLQPGFDCHGLPVEVIVEKELGITSKSDIERMGVEKFDAACLEKVLNNEKKFFELYRAVGAWRGWFDGYFTYKDYFIESAWWTAKQLHERGLLVEGEKPVHWCPHCETALSGYEVSDSYKDLSAPSVYLKFKVKGAENEFLLVWTTTPWTLPANVAVAVHPDEYYVRAMVGSDVLVVAEKRVAAALGEEVGVGYKVVGRLKGSELEGLEYEPLLDVPQQRELGAGARRVVLSIPIMTNKKYKKHVMRAETARPGGASGEKQDLVEAEEFEEFVAMDAGSGLVHVAPGHGQTDYFLGKHYGLPCVSPVDEHGRFTEKAGEFAGWMVEEANEAILRRLEGEGKLLHAAKFTHRAAVCWRCKTPLIFRLSHQWYLKVDPLKEAILSANESIAWLPEFGRVKFQNWIADREDWCLSQQRYWGIPMPIWVCSKCGAKRVVGSRKELAENALREIDVSRMNDLHRHVVDGVELKCGVCGSVMRRVKDIFTVWFDSGVTPWASLGYPYSNKELFEEMFPVSLVCESQDQVRGWFDSLMLCSMGVFEKPAYKSVALMGWVLDDKGEKMSKSLGNFIYGKDAVAELGADVVRLYYCSGIAPWEVQNFSLKTAKELWRDLSILYNVLSFYEMYFDAGLPRVELGKAALRVEDKWLISRLNTVAARVAAHLEEFEFHLAGRALLDFVVDDLSRWYVKLVRDRVAVGVPEGERAVALAVLRRALIDSAKLFAPITPFLAEYVFQRLKSEGDAESVHYEKYPSLNELEQDLALEEQMFLAMQVTEAVNSARQEAGIKLRWPVREVVVAGDNRVRVAVERLNGVLRVLNNALSVRAVRELPAGLVARQGRGFAVGIARELDEELLNAALLRELSRAVQDARKKAGLSVRDFIALKVFAGGSVLGFLKGVSSEFAREVGAREIVFVGAEGELGANRVEAGVAGKRVLASFERV
jgi:isoleucyl-tRNA synthetase